MTDRESDRPPEPLPGNNAANSPATRSPDETAPAILKALYDAKKSWRIVAKEVGGVSPALVWKVAHERCESTRVNTALGLTEKRYRMHYECGRGESGRERDAQLRSEIAAAGCESFTEYVDLMRSER